MFPWKIICDFEQLVNVVYKGSRTQLYSGSISLEFNVSTDACKH